MEAEKKSSTVLKGINFRNRGRFDDAAREELLLCCEDIERAVVSARDLLDASSRDKISYAEQLLQLALHQLDDLRKAVPEAANG